MEKDKTKQAVDIFDKHAQMYQSKYMSVEKYHEQLNIFCSSLPNKKASILELACGPGNITKYLLSQNPKLSILATDLSPAMLKLTEENNPTVTVQLLDCRSILDLNSKFDAVVCGFGLPYVSKEDAVKMIKDVSVSLNDGGLIYLSTMEDDYTKSGITYSSSNPEECMYMYFHEAFYLEEAMKKNGFQIIEISRVKYIHNNEAVTDLIIIGKK